MAQFQPPPTYVMPIEINPVTREVQFEPNWLKWFLDLSQDLTDISVVTGLITTPQVANTIFAGPSTGADAIPTFRALETADYPDESVTYAKIQDVTNSRLLGRSAGAAGPPMEITVGSGLSLAAGALTATGGTGDVVGPGSATDNAVTRFDGATGKLIQNSAVFIDDSARLLVGNATSIAFDGSEVQPFQVHGTGTTFPGASLFQWSATAGSRPILSLNRSRGATVGTHTVVQNGDAIGLIMFNASNGTTFSEAGYIFAHVDGVAAAGDIPSRISVWTTPDGTVAPVEAIRWDNAQRQVLGGIAAVTVGNAGRLQVNGGNASNSQVQISRFSADANPPSLVLSKSRHATVGSNTIVQSGDVLGVISAYGADGTNYDQAAQIVFEVGGTPGAGTDMPGRIRVQVSPDGSATPADALVIEANKDADFAANLDANSYSVAGAAGASGTGTVISAITVVNGIITAITVA